MKLAGARVLVFDLDYTLLDSSDGIVYCFNQARKWAGEREVDPALVKSRIGLPIEESFRVFGSADPARMREEFRRRAREGEMAKRSFLLPGVAETLPVLAGRGFRMAVVSTKSRPEIVSILDHLGVGGFFEECVGSDQVENPKPAPDSLLLLMQKLALDPAEVVYVGDHVVDVKAARAAGIRVIAVRGGPSRWEDVTAERPDALAEDFKRVAELV